eukprot:m.39033 g.39033  ORF g.39033 m.39033 type:complete len:147 (+) comp32662_c0_seq3:1409-1849(+)
MERERERHAAQMSQLQNELESAKELLVTYEESIARKDTVLANLTKAVQKQRERLELQKNFSAWKIHHCDEQREEFASKLARRHYWRTVGLKIWKAWHGVLEAKWRQRVEKACQVAFCVGSLSFLLHTYRQKLKKFATRSAVIMKNR